MKNACGFFVAAAAICFSFAPKNDTTDKINYKKLRADAGGTYRQALMDSMRSKPSAYFPLLSHDMKDMNLLRFVSVDLDDYPATATVKTTLPDFQKHLRLVEIFTDHNENGVFEAQERDELEFHFLDGAFKTDETMHRLDITILYENGKPDMIDRDEVVEQNGDTRDIRESFMTRLPERYAATRDAITNIMADPTGTMAERRKASFSF